MVSLNFYSNIGTINLKCRIGDNISPQESQIEFGNFMHSTMVMNKS